jgi:hypothetical protein
MKTAISIPDPTFQAAERYATAHNLSRSELYTAAILEYLKTRTKANITEQINAVCAEVDTASDPFFQHLSASAITSAEDWD